MPVDKNLFLHDLAVVAILKNEGPYLKEWLDYHLLAGVEHFYLYDNESPDNQAAVAAPYVKAGIVDYIPLPGKAMQFVAYNDALRFKFQARYMAFLDGDEFIFPKSAGSIADVVDEILSGKQNAAGVAINWQLYGSNGHETADYSKGVLERFTHRAPKNFSARLPSNITGGNVHVKTLADPRKINFVAHPHFPVYFETCHSVNENGKSVQGYNNNPVTADKIALNHYYTKSHEEFTSKQTRGRSDTLSKYDNEWFDVYDRNDEFDDGILHYRAARAKNFRPPDKSRAAEKLLNALMVNLSPTLLPNTPQEFYRGKLETFLTCRAVASYLQTRITDSAPAKFFEEAALKAIPRTFNGMNLAESRLFLRELPDLLSLKYPVVDDIRRAALQIVPQLINVFHMNNLWRDYSELNYLQRLLKIFGE